MSEQTSARPSAGQAPAGAKPRRRRSSTLILQLALIGAFLVVVWFVFGQTVLAPRIQGTAAPGRLGGMSLVSDVSGDQAIAQVDQLHGTNIDLLSAHIVEYASNAEQATVWVGRAVNQAAAATLLTRMIDGITKGGSGFSNVQQIKVGTHDVYQVDGPGGQHFFYQSMDPGTSVYGRTGSGTSVVWITLQTRDPMPLLEQAMKYF